MERTIGECMSMYSSEKVLQDVIKSNEDECEAGRLAQRLYICRELAARYMDPFGSDKPASFIGNHKSAAWKSI